METYFKYSSGNFAYEQYWINEYKNYLIKALVLMESLKNAKQHSGWFLITIDDVDGDQKNEWEWRPKDERERSTYNSAVQSVKGCATRLGEILTEYDKVVTAMDELGEAVTTFTNVAGLELSDQEFVQELTTEQHIADGLKNGTVVIDNANAEIKVPVTDANGEVHFYDVGTATSAGLTSIGTTSTAVAFAAANAGDRDLTDDELMEIYENSQEVVDKMTEWGVFSYDGHGTGSVDDKLGLNSEVLGPDFFGPDGPLGDYLNGVDDVNAAAIIGLVAMAGGVGNSLNLGDYFNTDGDNSTIAPEARSYINQAIFNQEQRVLGVTEATGVSEKTGFNSSGISGGGGGSSSGGGLSYESDFVDSNIDDSIINPTPPKNVTVTDVITGGEEGNSSAIQLPDDNLLTEMKSYEQQAYEEYNNSDPEIIAASVLAAVAEANTLFDTPGQAELMSRLSALGYSNADITEILNDRALAVQAITDSYRDNEISRIASRIAQNNGDSYDENNLNNKRTVEQLRKEIEASDDDDEKVSKAKQNVSDAIDASETATEEAVKALKEAESLKSQLDNMLEEYGDDYENWSDKQLGKYATLSKKYSDAVEIANQKAEIANSAKINYEEAVKSYDEIKVAAAKAAGIDLEDLDFSLGMDDASATEVFGENGINALEGIEKVEVPNVNGSTTPVKEGINGGIILGGAAVIGGAAIGGEKIINAISDAKEARELENSLPVSKDYDALGRKAYESTDAKTRAQQELQIVNRTQDLYENDKESLRISLRGYGYNDGDIEKIVNDKDLSVLAMLDGYKRGQIVKISYQLSAVDNNHDYKSSMGFRNINELSTGKVVLFLMDESESSDLAEARDTYFKLEEEFVAANEKSNLNVSNANATKENFDKFVREHGNDSSKWTSEEYQTYENLNNAKNISNTNIELSGSKLKEIKNKYLAARDKYNNIKEQLVVSYAALKVTDLVAKLETIAGQSITVSNGAAGGIVVDSFGQPNGAVTEDFASNLSTNRIGMNTGVDAAGSQAQSKVEEYTNYDKAVMDTYAHSLVGNRADLVIRLLKSTNEKFNTDKEVLREELRSFGYADVDIETLLKDETLSAIAIIDATIKADLAKQATKLATSDGKSDFVSAFSKNKQISDINGGAVYKFLNRVLKDVDNGLDMEYKNKLSKVFETNAGSL